MLVEGVIDNRVLEGRQGGASSTSDPTGLLISNGADSSRHCSIVVPGGGHVSSVGSNSYLGTL